ncbi:TIGR00282 family metallophosphoesterase [Thermovenabulum gondwanense]|uniref:TIGR00282 family metallophosphoesterase n=1 Tax=Thermovenabulum gondwanense TaxID=520767 RepID=UPI000837E8B3|nr:TIGR00282 family metallophosphoesterase [Thermovenabulum gondwanense]
MKILFIGDIVGRPGRNILKENLKNIIEEYTVDFVIANGENAAGGNGITKKVAEELFETGVNFLTMGNHVWDNKDIFTFIDNEERIIRPLNYPPGTPGKGSKIIEIKNNLKIGIINISGRTYMQNLDCPFRTCIEEIEKISSITNIIIVDFHAEATSEKQAMGWYLDGKVSAVIGTHTHVQTADERILPGGTAYITDVGMTGAFNSILGVEVEGVIKKFITQLPARFDVAKGIAQLNSVLIEIEENTGRATSINRINLLK